MPTKRCCCAPSCEIESDFFDRADSTNCGAKWHEISGGWQILGNTLDDGGTPGKIVTTTCHSAIHDQGSWVANFKLVDCRTRAKFEIGAGNPNSSTIRVEFIPQDIDTLGATIKIRLIGDTTVEFEHAWPTDTFGDSANIVQVFACYQPDTNLSASLGFYSGQPPVIQTCISGAGDNCYTAGGVDVGSFFFVEGRFDEWTLRVAELDDMNCDDCACTCMVANYPKERFSPEMKCIPKSLVAIFELVTTANICAPEDIEVPLEAVSDERDTWVSETIDLCDSTFALRAECCTLEFFSSKVIRGLCLTIATQAGQWGTGSNLFQVYEPRFDIGESGLLIFPETKSTCKPLSFVYEYVSLGCFFGPCSVVGLNGWHPWCCPEDCWPECPLILYRVTIVPA